MRRLQFKIQREEFDLERLRMEGALPPRWSNMHRGIQDGWGGVGEPIPNDVAHRSLEEARKCDLMLICELRRVVYPFADLPRVARQKKDRIAERLSSKSC